ncbi:Crp/Fnr family transcriptional regulator [Mucilaginibacter sp.]|jgi:CRP/FNR family transcriptional regulator|uniref:Crp/Fnr family transcriptional regulator n=1 Tax=Mucilaginibacter sp. TaxID=1882438 RepID=UPI0035641852
MFKTPLNCNLEKCFLCRHTPPGFHPAIDLHHRNLSFKKGETVFREGDPVTGIYFVYTGTAKVHKQWTADKELIIRFAAGGAIMGHRGLGSKLVYSVSATAVEPLVLCFVELEFFRETLQTNSALCYQLMVLFAEELENAEQKMRDLAHMPVKGRVAQALLRLEEQFGTNALGAIDFCMAWTDLADFTAATYETVFRTVRLLMREGMIAVTGKQITLLDRNRLTEVIANSVPAA